MKIASKAFSDFAATIPLIRSFSLGSNFPPEYPIFPGPPIRYHFVFFMVVGFLEKLGMRIDLALNILSSLVFTALMVGIYLLGKELFQKKSVGILAVFLFLFNSSLSFLEVFKNPNIKTISDLFSIDTFPSFGPYDGKIVSAFWNLNIYTNQRHLALGYAAFLFFIIFIIKCSKNTEKVSINNFILAGIFIGLFPFVHLPAFGAMLIATAISIVIFSNFRKKMILVLIVASILALPQFLYMGKSEVEVNLIKFGYLVENLNLLNFTKYWFFNLGLSAVMPIIAFVKSDRLQKRIFLIFGSLFVIGNIFQFGTDISTNHKFFNLFIIGMNIFSASLLVKMWGSKSIARLIVPIIFFLLTLSGVIDLIPIVRDHLITIQDFGTNQTVKFINDNTPKNSVFLNSSYTYNPASIAGRKIYMGWPYFSWGAGYNTFERSQNMKTLLNPISKNRLCTLLDKESIDYIEIKNPPDLLDIMINNEFFENNFIKVFADQENNISIYSVDLSCSSK